MQFRGITDVEVGYAGGHTSNPSYEQVCSETTGHAEVARVNFDETQIPAEIVLDNDATGAQTEKHQKRMMGEIAKLLGTEKPGYLDPAAYQRTVDTLLANPSTPVITKEPEGAWTHAVTDAAKAAPAQ